MSLKRADLLNSAIFRVSLINALLLVAALSAASAGAWFATKDSLTAAARERVGIEINALVSEFRMEGAQGVSSAIEWRSKHRGSLHYLFVEKGGAPVGDMLTVPRSSGWHRFTHGHLSQADHEIIARTVRTPDGTLIAVGEDLSAGETTRGLLFKAMLPIAAVAFAFAGLISVVATLRTLRRMNALMAVAQAVEQGDLSARIDRGRKPKDDIDALGGAINRMLDRIDVLVATVRRVSAEIAHDLRTPLTHARHALYTARWADNADRREASIDMASDSLGQALRSFDAMLRLAELDSGQVEAEFKPVVIEDVAERACDAYRAEIEASGRSLAFVRELHCTVQGDSDLLMQAIVNLLDNALKHTSPGASIVVRISAYPDGASVAVEDDGAGMTELEMETVLRPFGRLDKARNTDGSGLGLAIANSIARIHNGRVRVFNLEPGLSVALEIPCVRCARD